MLGQPFGSIPMEGLRNTCYLGMHIYQMIYTTSFPSLYYRHDTITRFINSLLQGLKISQCDELMHIALALTSGALHPPTSRD